MEEMQSSLQMAIPDMDPRIARSLSEMRFEKLTPIQEQTIPLLLAGKDVIGQAQTGTGKTAAFGIPLLQNIDPVCKEVQAIILCPTRELAIQASEELHRFAKYMHGIRILPIYGGQDITRQIRALKNVQIVVGTPGRVMDHMRRHTLRLNHIKMVVLDEADEMLNMGFREDIESILADVPKERQTALFSATMPKPILEITHAYQKEDAEYVRVTPKELTIPLIKQYYYMLRRDQKDAVTTRLLDYYQPKKCLIFCNTKKMVDELAQNLKKKGYRAEGLHGDLSQAQRDRVMYGFRSGMVEILIATDVAARGIDVDDVEAVFNYDIPQDIEYYVHRIGRTGRAGKSGRSFTLVTGRDKYHLRDIERVCGTRIELRRIPSAGDVMNAKAQKALSQVTEVYHEQDVSRMLPLIEELLSKESISAAELAAAFLKLLVGEDIEEIPEPVSRRRGANRRDSERSRNRGANRRDAEGSRNRSENKKAAEGSRSRSENKKAAEGSRNRAENKKAAEGNRSRGANRKDAEESRNRAENKKAAEGSQSRSENKKAAKGNRSRSENKKAAEGNRNRAENKKAVEGSRNSDRNRSRSGDQKGIEKSRSRHDHSGSDGKRQKLITGENKDLGYDTDNRSYQRPELGRPLEIKSKEPKMPAKKNGFLFFKKK